MALSRRSLRGALKAALAVLAVAALSPTKAAASCGDYLHVLPPGETAPPAAAAGMPGQDQGDRATPQPVRCPCRGPDCSQRSELPLLPTAPAPTTSPNQLEAILAAEPEADADRAVPLRGDSPTLPSAHPSSVFHPPRV